MNEKYRKTLGSLLYEIIAMQALLEQELSQDWKTYTITINDQTYELNPECEPEIRSLVIKTLLTDAISSYINGICFTEHISDPSFKVITQILEGSRKEDHQFEIYKEEVVSNLDADGNPITAKPLNQDSVYVQWQDQSKFKFEEQDV